MVDMLHSKYDGLPPSRNVAVDHGDAIDEIASDDKRYDPLTTKTLQIDQQIKDAIKKRKPIKNKLVCMLKGNHEHKLIRFTNATERISEGVGVTYGTWSSIINYLDPRGRILFKHFATHGCGSIKSDADDPVRQLSNKRLSLKRKLKNKFGDTLLNTCGHFHQLLVLRPEPILYLTSQALKINQNYTEPRKKSGYIEPNHKWYACCGSFLKMYENGIDTYSERAGYDPLELGFVICQVRNRSVFDLVKVPL